jgi:hypothetical protein
MTRSILHRNAVIPARGLAARRSAHLCDRVVQNLDTGRSSMDVNTGVTEREGRVSNREAFDDYMTRSYIPRPRRHRSAGIYCERDARRAHTVRSVS